MQSTDPDLYPFAWHSMQSQYRHFMANRWRDGRAVVQSIQYERERAIFFLLVFDDSELTTKARFCRNPDRTIKRLQLEAAVQAIFGRITYSQAVDGPTSAQSAYGAVYSVHGVTDGPQLRLRRPRPWSGKAGGFRQCRPVGSTPCCPTQAHKPEGYKV